MTFQEKCNIDSHQVIHFFYIDHFVQALIDILKKNNRSDIYLVIRGLIILFILWQDMYFTMSALDYMRDTGWKQFISKPDELNYIYVFLFRILFYHIYGVFFIMAPSGFIKVYLLAYMSDIIYFRTIKQQRPSFGLNVILKKSYLNKLVDREKNAITTINIMICFGILILDYLFFTGPLTGYISLKPFSLHLISDQNIIHNIYIISLVLLPSYFIKYFILIDLFKYGKRTRAGLHISH